MSHQHHFVSIDEVKATLAYQKLSDKAKNAIASLALEGLLPTPELLAEYVLLDSGTVDSETWLTRNRARILAKQSSLNAGT